MRGFVSYFLLILVASVGLAQYTLQTQTRGTSETAYFASETHALAFERSALEQGMDRTIAEKLQEGMLLQLTSEQIQTHINQALLYYLQARASEAVPPMQLEMGFSTLQTTNYFSLLDAPMQGLSLLEMNANSHVFVLPLNQTQQYGEYTYTGGAFGTHILLAKITGTTTATLAALPSGYRMCVWSASGEIPCTPI